MEGWKDVQVSRHVISLRISKNLLGLLWCSQTQWLCIQQENSFGGERRSESLCLFTVRFVLIAWIVLSDFSCRNARCREIEGSSSDKLLRALKAEENLAIDSYSMPEYIARLKWVAVYCSKRDASSASLLPVKEVSCKWSRLESLSG